MFTSIEEGLQLYKNAIRQYLIRKREIDNREGQTRQTEGLDYRGRLDWPREDFEWAKAEQTRIDGMQTALGISIEEHDKITDEIRNSL